MAKKISGSVGKGGKNAPIDTSGQLVSTDGVDPGTGNPAPSAVLTFSAPASSSPQSAGIAFPIGEDFEFNYDPAEFGPVESLDFLIDILPNGVQGTPEVHITLAILQNEFFIADIDPNTPSIDGTEPGWTQLAQLGLRAEDFTATDGGPERPDFNQPFEFGYAFLADYQTTPLQVQLQLDNMEATVNTIPEPTLFALAIVLGAPLLLRRRYRMNESSV